MIETRFGFATRALSAIALALASAAIAAAPTPVGAEHGQRIDDAVLDQDEATGRDEGSVGLQLLGDMALAVIAVENDHDSAI